MKLCGIPEPTTIPSCPMSDQSVKADEGKLQLTLVPREMIREVAAIRMYGNSKYPEGGPDNWKKVEVERYRDAAFRHFLAYIKNPNGRDEESGLPHRWHLECNLAFLAELEDGKERIREGENNDVCQDCEAYEYYKNGIYAKCPKTGFFDDCARAEREHNEAGGWR